MNNDRPYISDVLPVEKSIAMRLIKKRKEVLDVSCTKKYLSLEDIEDITAGKKNLLEDVRVLKGIINPEMPEESWMLPELEKLEQELSEEEVLGERWNNILNNDYDKILEILEKKYLTAYEEYDAKEMENVLYLIRAVKKHIDNEIGRSIIEGKCNEDIISLNNQISNVINNAIKKT